MGEQYREGSSTWPPVFSHRLHGGTGRLPVSYRTPTIKTGWVGSVLGRGSDSEGLAVGLTGPSSSDLRHLPIGLIWLHLSSLIVGNIDIPLESVFSTSFPHLFCARDTESSSGGSALEAHPVGRESAPLLQPWRSGSVSSCSPRVWPVTVHLHRVFQPGFNHRSPAEVLDLSSPQNMHLAVVSYKPGLEPS